MRGYFFNAEPTTDLERHPTGYDREYDADSFADFFEHLLGTGVLLEAGLEESCQIYDRGGGLLGIREGAAFVRGRPVIFDGTETLTARSGHVVARMNKGMEVRDFQFLIVDTPVQGDGDIYDLPLAKIQYTAGSSPVITDEREFVTANVLGGHKHRAEDVEGVSGHTHSAGDIKPGTFSGDYTFNSDGDTSLKLTTGGTRVRSAEFQIHKDKSYLDIIAYNALTQYWRIKLMGYSANVKEILQLIRVADGEETPYRIFGEHNKPVVSGGYSGTGSTAKSVSLGAAPTLLIVIGSDSFGGLDSMAIITNFGETVNNDALGGIAILNCGNSPTMSAVQIGMNGTKLEVGSYTSGDAKFFNVTGRKYNYWGMTI